MDGRSGDEKAGEGLGAVVGGEGQWEQRHSPSSREVRKAQSLQEVHRRRETECFGGSEEC